MQCNFGGDLRILGVPIRPEITDLGTCTVLPQPLSRPWTRQIPPCRPIGVRTNAPAARDYEGRGSIIVEEVQPNEIGRHYLSAGTKRTNRLAVDVAVFDWAIIPACFFALLRPRWELGG